MARQPFSRDLLLAVIGGQLSLAGLVWLGTWVRLTPREVLGMMLLSHLLLWAAVYAGTDWEDRP